MIEENLLIELVTEELPPQSQKELGESFGKNIFESLTNHKLISASTFEVYSTPRRLGVKITKVLSEASTEKKLIKLMPKKIGFDVNGNAQQALIKKLESIGEKESSVSKIITKEEVLYIEKEIVGKKLYEIIEGLIRDCLIKLPIKKVMTYQLSDGWETVNFVRPAKNLVILHGNKLINATILGIKSSRTTVGHRFESKNKVIERHSIPLYFIIVEAFLNLVKRISIAIFWMQYHDIFKGESYEFGTSNSMFSHGKKYQYCSYLFFFRVQKKASQIVIDFNPNPSQSKVIGYLLKG